MKLETYLNAMAYSLMKRSYLEAHTLKWYKRQRQLAAFRARILRMDAEKDKRLEQWEIYHGFHMGDEQMIETITEKDAEIEELKGQLAGVDGFIHMMEEMDDMV